MLTDSIFTLAMLCSVGIVPISHAVGTGGLLQALAQPAQIRALPGFIHLWLRNLLHEMAELAARSALTVLLPPKVLARRLDPYIMAGILAEPMQQAAHKAVADALGRHSPMVWEVLPGFVQARIKQLAAQKVPLVSIEVAKAICTDPSRFADLKSQVVKKMLSHPRVLIDLVVEAGQAPMQFLFKLSAVWGVVLALLAFACLALTDSALLAVMLCVVMGSALHWIAIELLYFKPCRILGMQLDWYGPFYTRQNDISRAYTRVVVTELMLVDDLMVELTSGVRASRLHKMLHVLVSDAVDDAVRSLKPVVVNVLGVRNWQNVKHDIAESFWAELGMHLPNARAYVEDSLDLGNTIQARLDDMSSREFEEVLRPTAATIERYYPLLGAVAGGLLAVLVSIAHAVAGLV